MRKLGLLGGWLLAAAIGGTAVAQTTTKKEESAIGPASVVGAPLTEPKAKADSRRFTPAEVRAMQQHLVKTGYLKARPSTKWTPAAKKAMREWQKANGLAVTGRINSESFAYVEPSAKK